MAVRIEEIEGIGPKYGELLRAAGVKSPAQLLAAGATRKARQALAEKTGIDDGRILRWVHLADLCLIKGISTQYSELLEAAGVDTIKALRNRNAQNLVEKIQQLNASKELVRQSPSLRSVTDWISQAKTMEPAVSY